MGGNLGGGGISQGRGDSIQLLDNYQLVKNVDNLPTPVGDVITLIAPIQYQFNGKVNISPNRLVLPTGAFIFGLSFNSDGIISDTTGALITATSASIEVQALNLEAPNGSLYDITGTGLEPIILQENVSFTTPTIGTITNAGNLIMDSCAYLFFTDGLTIAGSLNGGQDFSITIFSGFTGTAINYGTSVVQEVTMTRLTFAGTGGSSEGISGLGSSGNIGISAIVNGCKFNNIDIPLVGIQVDDLKWEFSSNPGLENSSQKGFVIMPTNAVETSIDTQGLPVKLAGTFTDKVSKRFTISSTGRATYIGITTTDLAIRSNFRADQTAGNNIDIQFFIVFGNDTINVINAFTDVGGGATEVTTNIDHGFTTGDRVPIDNSTVGAYDAVHTITVTGSDLFTIPVAFISDSAIGNYALVCDDTPSGDRIDATDTRNITMIDLIEDVQTGGWIEHWVQNNDSTSNVIVDNFKSSIKP